MKRSFREMVIEAHRLHGKGLGFPEIAKKLNVGLSEEVMGFVRAGERISVSESCRLTDNELLLMRALVRAEIRAIETDTWPPKTSSVDFSAGMKPGWCVRTAAKRLRMAYDEEPGPHNFRLNYVFHTPQNAASKHSGRMWLTAAGWAYVWDAGLLDIQTWKETAA